MPAYSPSKYLKKEASLALLLTALFTIFYNLFFFNKYLPFTEGWFSLYADLMRRGYSPYKDFYLLLTPLYPKFIQLFSYLFGPEFIKLRIFGILLFTFISLLIFKISQIFTSPWKSLLIATACVVILESGNAFINYDYIYVYICLNLIATYLLLLAKVDEKKSIYPYLLFGSGIFASLSFLTKQSNGAFFAVFLYFSCFFSSSKSTWQIFRSSLAFAWGALLPIALTALWLINNDSLQLALNQILFQASSSKGSLTTAITKWGVEFFNEHFLAVLHKIFIVFMIFWIASNSLLDKIKIPEKLFRYFTLLAICAGFIAVIPDVAPYLLAVKPISIAAKLVTDGNYWLVGILLISTFTNHLTRKKLYLILVTASIGAMWGSGTSAGLTQISLILTIIAVFIFLLNFNFITSTIAFVLLSSVILIYPAMKYEAPFSWWGYTLPAIRDSNVKLEMGYGKGLYTSSELANSYNTLYQLMNSGDKQSNTSLVFPHMPIFQLNSDTIPFGKAGVYWFDFLSNDLMDNEIELLNKERPEFILLIDVPRSTWEGHRNLFRAGGSMSHDQFLEKIRALTSSQYSPLTQKIPLGGDYEGVLFKLKN